MTARVIPLRREPQWDWNEMAKDNKTDHRVLFVLQHMQDSLEQIRKDTGSLRAENRRIWDRMSYLSGELSILRQRIEITGADEARINQVVDEIKELRDMVDLDLLEVVDGSGKGEGAFNDLNLGDTKDTTDDVGED